MISWIVLILICQCIISIIIALDDKKFDDDFPKPKDKLFGYLGISGFYQLIWLILCFIIRNI